MEEATLESFSGSASDDFFGQNGAFLSGSHSCTNRMVNALFRVAQWRPPEWFRFLSKVSSKDCETSQGRRKEKQDFDL